ncbi:hypothetical protein ACFLZW_00845 [Chloroflexota bacterium]
MAETLLILKDTPIPTLMILGGIALLVLSVVSSISDKVKVAPERQKWAGIAGLILIVIGTALYLIQPAGSAPAATSTPVVTSRATATQKEATGTPIASVTLPAATVTVVTNCANQPAYFEEYWSERIAQLGCPLAAQAGGYKITQQSFENGWMFGRPNILSIYVLLDDRSYQVFNDTWKSDQDIYSCPDTAVSQTPPTPRYGFGLVWCNSQAVRSGLGLATAAEQSLSATLQAFDNGLIFEVKKDIFLLDERQESWEQLK